MKLKKEKINSAVIRIVPFFFLWYSPLLFAQITYSGHIGPYPIELTLHYPIKKATEPAYFQNYTPVLGSYTYTKFNKDISLRGIWDMSAALLLIEEAEDGPILFEFSKFHPKMKYLNGYWKGKKKFPIQLTQVSIVPPEKLPPLRYEGIKDGHLIELAIEEPFERVRIKGMAPSAIKRLINQTKGTLFNTKSKDLFSLRGSWGERGFTMKGFESDNNILFWCHIEDYDKAYDKIQMNIVGDHFSGEITFFKVLDVLFESIQKVTTDSHFFKLVRYRENKEDQYGQTAIEIYSKKTGGMIQRILGVLDCNGLEKLPLEKNPKTMEVGDFDSDGDLDVRFICLRHIRSVTYAVLLHDNKQDRFYLKKVHE